MRWRGFTWEDSGFGPTPAGKPFPTVDPPEEPTHEHATLEEAAHAAADWLVSAVGKHRDPNES